MRVRAVVSGEPRGAANDVRWPEGWPAPAQGDLVDLGGQTSANTYLVNRVIWHPHGDSEDPVPFVYVVLVPPARRLH